MAMTKDHVYLCMDEGVCCICGRSIVWGEDAIYTINGAHYDCQFPPDTRRQHFERHPLLDDPRPTGGYTDKLRLARANGGHLLHWVKGYSSLCGHTPQSRSNVMRSRGKWLFIPNNTNITQWKLCETCEAKHAKLQEG